MTLKEFWDNKDTLYIHCKTEEEINTFYLESDRLGKKWSDDTNFIKNHIDFKNKGYRIYFDNQGHWASESFINHYSLFLIKKYQLLEFDEIDFENETKGENKQMELKDTITLMTSVDYKERFKAEYSQVKIRYEKLLAMIEKWEKGELTFTPTCPKETYNFQLKSMKEYLDILVIRAKLENIDLGE